MKKMLKRRSGFTLVELLIVIIIIGILAGAMLLVAGSGTDKAEATKIVSNLRSMKIAALLYFADKAVGTAGVTTPGLSDLNRYMDRTIAAPYAVEDISSGDVTAWSVGYKSVAGGVAGKLREMAEADGLYSDKECTTGYETNGAGEVYMRAR
jgi:general secretion pathway protein G